MCDHTYSLSSKNLEAFAVSSANEKMALLVMIESIIDSPAAIPWTERQRAEEALHMIDAAFGSFVYRRDAWTLDFVLKAVRVAIRAAFHLHIYEPCGDLLGLVRLWYKHQHNSPTYPDYREFVRERMSVWRETEELLDTLRATTVSEEESAIFHNEMVRFQLASRDKRIAISAHLSQLLK